MSTRSTRPQSKAKGKGKGKFQGQCRRCGKWGHKRDRCTVVLAVQDPTVSCVDQQLNHLEEVLQAAESEEVEDPH